MAGASNTGGCAKMILVVREYVFPNGPAAVIWTFGSLTYSDELYVSVAVPGVEALLPPPSPTKAKLGIGKDVPPSVHVSGPVPAVVVVIRYGVDDSVAGRTNAGCWATYRLKVWLQAAPKMFESPTVTPMLLTKLPLVTNKSPAVLKYTADEACFM